MPLAISDHDITGAMMIFGGLFVARLGELYRCGDPVNQRILRDAFPGYWAEYRALVALQRERQP